MRLRTYVGFGLNTGPGQRLDARRLSPIPVLNPESSLALICNLIAIGSRDFRVHDFSTDHELHMVWHLGAVYMSRASPAKRADSILSRLVVA